MPRPSACGKDLAQILKSSTTAYRNDYVVILESEGDWYKVIYNLREGYMHSDYLTVKERENVELGYGEVNTYLVNLRSGPTTSSEILDQLAEGEDAYIIGFNCGWYKVQYNGSTGYIRSDLVDLTEIPYENTGSSSSPKYFAGETPSAAPLTSPLSATKRSPSPPKATSKSPRLSPTRAMSRNLSLSPPKATNPKLLKATSRNPNPNPPKATNRNPPAMLPPPTPPVRPLWPRPRNIWASPMWGVAPPPAVLIAPALPSM